MYSNAAVLPCVFAGSEEASALTKQERYEVVHAGARQMVRFSVRISDHVSVAEDREIDARQTDVLGIRMAYAREAAQTSHDRSPVNSEVEEVCFCDLVAACGEVSLQISTHESAIDVCLKDLDQGIDQAVAAFAAGGAQIEGPAVNAK